MRPRLRQVFDIGRRRGEIDRDDKMKVTGICLKNLECVKCQKQY